MHDPGSVKCGGEDLPGALGGVLAQEERLIASPSALTGGAVPDLYRGGGHSSMVSMGRLSPSSMNAAVWPRFFLR